VLGYTRVLNVHLMHSVLWLLRFPPYGERHIHTEAAARGIDPSRIIFTDVAAKPVRRLTSCHTCRQSAMFVLVSGRRRQLLTHLVCGIAGSFGPVIPVRLTARATSST